jgi:hypothetical protein
VAFWGLIGVGLALEGIGIPLVAGFESGGWQTFGFVLVAAGIVALFSALVIRVRSDTSGGDRQEVVAGRDAATASAGRDAYAAGRDINISNAQGGAKKRDVVSTTPEQLMAFYDGHTSAQGDRLAEPYKDNWIRGHGTVSDVWESSIEATVMIMALTDKPLKVVLARFEKPFARPVLLLHKGAEVQVVGQVASVSATKVELVNCELEDLD